MRTAIPPFNHMSLTLCLIGRTYRFTPIMIIKDDSDDDDNCDPRGLRRFRSYCTLALGLR
jgi:hypothetical protein